MAPSRKKPPQAAERLASIIASLEDGKAEDIIVIDLAGKTSMADHMVVVTGRSKRHVASLASHMKERLKASGVETVPIEGMPQGDWVLLDAGDVIVHLFQPEVRAFYNIEKMWHAPNRSSDEAETQDEAEEPGTEEPGTLRA